MVSSIGLEVKGIPKVSAMLLTKKKGIGLSINKALTKSAIFLQGEVKMSIAGKRDEFMSVDTGRFLNSVDFQTKKDSAVIFSKVPYADKLEHGTNFKNSPRKHFTNSANRSKQKVTSIIQKEINKI